FNFLVMGFKPLAIFLHRLIGTIEYRGVNFRMVGVGLKIGCWETGFLLGCVGCCYENQFSLVMNPFISCQNLLYKICGFGDGGFMAIAKGAGGESPHMRNFLVILQAIFFPVPKSIEPVFRSPKVNS